MNSAPAALYMLPRYLKSSRKYKPNRAEYATSVYETVMVGEVTCEVAQTPSMKSGYKQSPHCTPKY